MKYRPKIESINDLQDGDEFLVGESRWVWEDSFLKSGSTVFKQSTSEPLARDLIQAEVPIESDIPCPPGYELRMGDDMWIVPEGAKLWGFTHRFKDCRVTGHLSCAQDIYAIPIKTREFEGTVFNQMRTDRSCFIGIPVELPGGTRVRVTVLEEGE
jgi:hypothetical protein